MMMLYNAHESMVRRSEVLENRVFPERPKFLSLFRTYQNDALEGRILPNSPIESS
jgi:hypothetical protein